VKGGGDLLGEMHECGKNKTQVGSSERRPSSKSKEKNARQFTGVQTAKRARRRESRSRRFLKKLGENRRSTAKVRQLDQSRTDEKESCPDGERRGGTYSLAKGF